MSDLSSGEAARGAHRAPAVGPDTTAATPPDLAPEVEQAWLRPRGRNRYPEASWPEASRGRGSAPAPEGSPPAAGPADLGTAATPAADPVAAPILASRSRGRRANPVLDPDAAAAERLAADRATVAAQGEALRRVTRGRREADRVRRDAEAVRPPATIEGAVRQNVTPAGAGTEETADTPRAATPGRRLIAGGLFARPLPLPDADSGDEVSAVSLGERRDPERPADSSLTAEAPAEAPAAPSAEAPAAPSAVDDVATRAIAVVRRAGPAEVPDGSSDTADSPRRTLVMGILNVTLDSFSDGGRFARYDDAIAHARALVADGADIIDVGGESTRPGAPRVDVHEEQRRVIPVIRELVALGFRVSVDTMNAATAFSAIEAGAEIVNDVSGGLADTHMAQVVKDTDVTYVAMHWRGHSDTMNSRAVYSDAVAEVKAELFHRVAELVVLGVRPDRIVIDPGLGFAKLAEHNWQLLGHLSELSELGLPILVAASRKRFLGALLPEEAGVGERDPATAVISALSAQAGAWGVRVHDVATTRAALDVWEAWQKGSRG